MLIEVADSAPELDLRRYLDVLRRRRMTIFASMLGLVALTLAISFVRTPVYEGKARVILERPSTASLFGGDQPDFDPEIAVSTEIEVIKSAPVRASVTDRIGPAPDVEVARVATSLMIEVRARSTDQDRAAEAATAYAQAYIDYRRQQATQDLLTVAGELERTLADLERELVDLEAGGVSATGPESDAAAVARRDALVSQRSVFRQRLDELQFQAAVDAGQARLVSASPIPESPVSPKPLRSGVLAAVAGLILGMIVAAVREHLDDSIKTRAEVSEAIRGVPVLGAIPLTPGRAAREPGVIALSAASSPASESFRAVRTSVQLLGIDTRLRTIQITSPRQGEGKTTLLANLAAVMAEAGERVVVVDCDLRKPRAHLAFGAARSPGFTSIMSGEQTLQEALQHVSIGDATVAVLGAGPIPPNPSELLASKRTSQLFFDLQALFDIVLVDSPPVLVATDPTVLSAWVDATVLVASAGLTTRRDLQLTVETLRQVEARLVGVVLNRADDQTQGYGYQYGDELHRRPGRVRSMSAARRARREDDPEQDAELASGAQRIRW